MDSINCIKNITDIINERNRTLIESSGKIQGLKNSCKWIEDEIRRNELDNLRTDQAIEFIEKQIEIIKPCVQIAQNMVDELHSSINPLQEHRKCLSKDIDGINKLNISLNEQYTSLYNQTKADLVASTPLYKEYNLIEDKLRRMKFEEEFLTAKINVEKRKRSQAKAISEQLFYHRCINLARYYDLQQKINTLDTEIKEVEEEELKIIREMQLTDSKRRKEKEQMSTCGKFVMPQIEIQNKDTALEVDNNDKEMLLRTKVGILQDETISTGVPTEFGKLRIENNTMLDSQDGNKKTVNNILPKKPNRLKEFQLMKNKLLKRKSSSNDLSQNSEASYTSAKRIMSLNPSQKSLVDIGKSNIIPNREAANVIGRDMDMSFEEIRNVMSQNNHDQNNYPSSQVFEFKATDSNAVQSYKEIVMDEANISEMETRIHNPASESQLEPTDLNIKSQPTESKFNDVRSLSQRPASQELSKRPAAVDEQNVSVMQPLRPVPNSIETTNLNSKSQPTESKFFKSMNIGINDVRSLSQRPASQELFKRPGAVDEQNVSVMQAPRPEPSSIFSSNFGFMGSLFQSSQSNNYSMFDTPNNEMFGGTDPNISAHSDVEYPKSPEMSFMSEHFDDNSATDTAQPFMFGGFKSNFSFFK